MKRSYRNVRARKHIKRLRNLQILHGNIKRFNYPKNAEHIMELGSGKLNDLLNWAHRGIKNVHAIEIDQASIDEGNKKYRKYKDRSDEHSKLPSSEKKALKDRFVPTLPDINQIRGDLTKDADVAMIMKTLSSLYMSVDHIICNFAIHYFMKDRHTVNLLVKLVDYFLKTGGTFSFTTIDGKVLYDNFNTRLPTRIETTDLKPLGSIDKLIKKINIKTFNVVQEGTSQTTKKKNVIEYNHDNFTYFRLRRKYPSDENFLSYGQEISVYVISIGKPHTEYLVNVEYLMDKFDKRGYIIGKITRFDEYIQEYVHKRKIIGKLTPAEYDYSRLNVYVSFIREVVVI